MPVGGGSRSTQSARMPLESVYCSSNAALGSTFLTSASSCTSPNAPRERLSPSSSWRLTTLPVRLSIFFCASSMVARRCMTLTKVSLVFLKPSSRRSSTLPAIWSRRWSILAESRSLESVRLRPSRSPCWVSPVCRSVSIARCFSSSSGATAATGSLSEFRKRAKPSASQTRTAKLAAATISAISAMGHCNSGARSNDLAQRRHRRTAQGRACARPDVQEDAREPESGAGEPDPAAPDEIELEHARRERPADCGRAERAEKPCDRAENGELGALRRKHLGAARPQRPHHRRLVRALVLGREKRRVQHQHAGAEREQEYQLHRADQLVHHELQLPQDYAHVDHGEVGKRLRQAQGQERVARRRMKACDIARGEALEQCRRGDEEEIRAHRVPIELAHARDRRGEAAARGEKFERIADPDAEALGDPALDRYRATREIPRTEPGALGELVVGGQCGQVGHVELALDLALRTLLRKILRTHRLSVDGDQPRAHHGEALRPLHAVALEELGQKLSLLGLDVDEKPGGRVRREPPAPGVEQIAPDQGEEQDRGECHRDRHDLHGVGTRAPQEVREAVTPGDAAGPAEPPDQLQGAVADRRKDSESGGKAPEHVTRKLQLARLPEKQPEHRGQSHDVYSERPLPRGADVAPDHAQRRHIFELEQRRQGKP